MTKQQPPFVHLLKIRVASHANLFAFIVRTERRHLLALLTFLIYLTLEARVTCRGGAVSVYLSSIGQFLNLIDNSLIARSAQFDFTN